MNVMFAYSTEPRVRKHLKLASEVEKSSIQDLLHRDILAHFASEINTVKNDYLVVSKLILVCKVFMVKSDSLFQEWSRIQ
jgi:hypothetical protein